MPLPDAERRWELVDGRVDIVEYSERADFVFRGVWIRCRECPSEVLGEGGGDDCDDGESLGVLTAPWARAFASVAAVLEFSGYC